MIWQAGQVSIPLQRIALRADRGHVLLHVPVRAGATHRRKTNVVVAHLVRHGFSKRDNVKGQTAASHKSRKSCNSSAHRKSKNAHNCVLRRRLYGGKLHSTSNPVVLDVDRPEVEPRCRTAHHAVQLRSAQTICCRWLKV